MGRHAGLCPRPLSESASPIRDLPEPRDEQLLRLVRGFEVPGGDAVGGGELGGHALAVSSRDNRMLQPEPFDDVPLEKRRRPNVAS